MESKLNTPPYRNVRPDAILEAYSRSQTEGGGLYGEAECNVSPRTIVELLPRAYQEYTPPPSKSIYGEYSFNGEKAAKKSKLMREAVDVLKGGGVFGSRYWFPAVLFIEPEMELFHRDSPTRHALWENDHAVVIIKDEHLNNPFSVNKHTVAHELSHGIHDAATMAAHSTPDNPIMRPTLLAFKKWMVGFRHLGFVEGVMETLSYDDLDWKRIGEMTINKQWLGLNDLEAKMLDLERGPFVYHSNAYQTAHAIVSAMQEVINNDPLRRLNMATAMQSRTAILNDLKLNPMDPETNVKNLFLATLVEYMVQMFPLFQSSQKPQPFQEFFTSITGIPFYELEQEASTHIQNKLHQLGYTAEGESYM